MKILMSYAEMSFLRELVQKAQLDIWKKRWLPGLEKKDLPATEIEDAFNRIMNREMKNWEPISSDEDCCSVLLKRFQEAESSILNRYEVEKR